MFRLQHLWSFVKTFEYQGWTNLLLRPQFFGRSGTLKNEARKINVNVHIYLRNNLKLLCYINRACSFNFWYNSIRSFYNEAFAVWMLFECLKWNTSQRIIFILQTHPSKGAQKNMLVPWNFKKYKLWHISFHNNMLKNCGTNILESDKSDTTQTLLIVVLMVVLKLF